eukprot:Nitzschia sp. Nitz4//scaffold68_size99682//54977//55618//NITZ4_004568-RA/size99682-processed-gene-0.42-mRNA-1//-1//CDS//3329556605//9388//frame0
MPCPFEAKLGFSTKETREEYVDWKLERSPGSTKEEIQASLPESLEADLDVTKPLYFWQLFSILGKEPIIDIATGFYTRIFDPEVEDDAVFRAAFTNVGAIDMHIKAQSNYWIDSFGGGKVYWGGHSRLGFHHFSKHAEPVMNAGGSKRWLWHMKHVISSFDFEGKFGDPRIVPCLVEFLASKVWSYANEFGWEFDETDFHVEDFTYAKKAQTA